MHLLFEHLNPVLPQTGGLVVVIIVGNGSVAALQFWSNDKSSIA